MTGGQQSPGGGPSAPPPVRTHLSVADEGRHGGQAGLDALVPRQHVLLVAVQELVQDPAGVKQPMRRAPPHCHTAANS